uniref:Uncharacterized protein n=1 Tax=viral metagenome TaxID=1070528 RepID=A0A6C0CVQ6_9ZZZZ
MDLISTYIQNIINFYFYIYISPHFLLYKTTSKRENSE